MIGRHFSSVKNNICYFGDKVLFSRCVLLESAAEWVSNNVRFILFSVLLKTFILPLKFYLRVIFQIFFFLIKSEIDYFNCYTVDPLGISVNYMVHENRGALES